MPCRGGCSTPDPTRDDFLTKEEKALLEAIDELCDLVQKAVITKTVLPPKLAAWWEIHKKVDAARVKREVEAQVRKAEEAKKESAKKYALQKLTPYERGLLGLK